MAASIAEFLALALLATATIYLALSVSFWARFKYLESEHYLKKLKSAAQAEASAGLEVKFREWEVMGRLERDLKGALLTQYFAERGREVPTWSATRHHSQEI